ncbi:YobF family protein [Escherichia coli]|nr:YobF family protein [Escherichia coli]
MCGIFSKEVLSKPRIQVRSATLSNLSG